MSCSCSPEMRFVFQDGTEVAWGSGDDFLSEYPVKSVLLENSYAGSYITFVLGEADED